jgi:hypothetical protein
MVYWLIARLLGTLPLNIDRARCSILKYPPLINMSSSVEPDPDSHPTHELTKAFLFLRTASTAITNLKTQVESTKACCRWNSVNGNYNEHWAYEEELATQEKDLEVWETRYAQAGAGLVNWTAKVKTGNWLPAEIFGMIGEMLYSHGMDLPRIW